MDTHIHKKMIITMMLQRHFYHNKIQNPNPGRWKTNNFVDPVLGSLVYQISEDVTLYDLSLGCTIARWKGINEEIQFGGSIKAFDYDWGARSLKKFI